MLQVLKFFQLLDVLFQEHQAEADEEQQAGQPDGPAAMGASARLPRPAPSANRKMMANRLKKKMARLTSELSDLFKQSHKLEAEIKEKLGAIGYEI